MCLGIPAKVLSVSGETASVEVGSATREVSVILLDRVEPGEWVILHAGFAIQKLDPDEAERTLELFREIADVL